MKEQLKSEYLKFMMNPWHWLIIGALLLCVPALVIFLNNKPDQLTLQFVLEQLLQSLYLGQAGFVSLAVLFIGREFTGSSLRTSFLTCPNRLKFIISKLAIVLLSPACSSFDWYSCFEERGDDFKNCVHMLQEGRHH